MFSLAGYKKGSTTIKGIYTLEHITLAHIFLQFFLVIVGSLFNRKFIQVKSFIMLI